MTDDELALLRTVAADPESDVPRLVYADWLEENGHALRAEFIRLQIDISKLDDKPQVVRNRYVDWFRRQHELLEDHRYEIMPSLTGLASADRREFERGFLSRLDYTVSAFLDFAAELTDLVPLPDIHVNRVGGRLFEFLQCRHTPCITHLAVFSADLDPMLIGWNPDDRLTALDDPFPRLKSLDLEGCLVNDLLAEWVFQFHLPALVELDVSNNQITDAGVITLLGTALPRQLKRLVLGGNPLGDQAAMELADRWPRGSPLENLNLRGTNIGRAGHAALTARFGSIVDLF